MGVSADIVTLLFSIFITFLSEISKQDAEHIPAQPDLVEVVDPQTPDLRLMNTSGPSGTIIGCSLVSFFLAGSSVHGAEFGHLPDNITVLEGESVTLR